MVAGRLEQAEETPMSKLGVERMRVRGTPDHFPALGRRWNPFLVRLG